MYKRQDYNTVPYDIALCLGSINFGDEDTIDRQIDKLHTLWRREAIFRVNPGIKHTGVKYENIEWYPWTQKKIYDIAKQYNYVVKDMKIEHTDKNELRYFFIYTK